MPWAKMAMAVGVNMIPMSQRLILWNMMIMQVTLAHLLCTIWMQNDDDDDKSYSISTCVNYCSEIVHIYWINIMQLYFMIKNGCNNRLISVREMTKCYIERKNAKQERIGSG